MTQLAGQVALITGAASGIGLATARLFAEEGARIVLCDVDAARGAAAAAELSAMGVEALFVELDVTDPAHWGRAIDSVEGRFGALNILVANAGIALRGYVADMTFDDWRRQNAINLDGVFLSAKYSLPLMRRSGGGSICIVSSVAGLRGSSGFAGYCASKGGVRYFAKALALECCELGDAIRVNSIHPGVVKTPLWNGVLPGDAPRAIDADRLGQSDAPLGRSCAPEEVASAILYLASPAAAYVTGAELVIDGGITAGAMPKRRRAG